MNWWVGGWVAEFVGGQVIRREEKARTGLGETSFLPKTFSTVDFVVRSEKIT